MHGIQSICRRGEDSINLPEASPSLKSPRGLHLENITYATRQYIISIDCSIFIADRRFAGHPYREGTAYWGSCWILELFSRKAFPGDPVRYGYAVRM
jgi:hypothetical protein